jgi:hypothetical protein
MMKQDEDSLSLYQLPALQSRHEIKDLSFTILGDSNDLICLATCLVPEEEVGFFLFRSVVKFL